MTPADNAPRATLHQLGAEDTWHSRRQQFYDELLADDWDDGEAWREAATLAGDSMDSDEPARVRY